MDDTWTRRTADGRLALIEARVNALETNQREHRAILLGDALEGRGGLRGDLSKLTEDMKKRFAKQNGILYLLLLLVAMAAPGHVQEVISFFGKLFAK